LVAGRAREGDCQTTGRKFFDFSNAGRSIRTSVSISLQMAQTISGGASYVDAVTHFHMIALIMREAVQNMNKQRTPFRKKKL